jgi:hypothetical protein
MPQKARKLNATKDIEHPGDFARGCRYPAVKKLSLTLAVLALALAAYLGSELSRTRRLLREQEERSQALASLKAKLASAGRSSQTALAQAEASKEALAKQLRDETQALATAEEHLVLLEARKVNAPMALRLGKGSYILDDGTVVYGPDAQIRLPNGMLVTSPTGVMVSDASLTHIDGDLVIESQQTHMVATNSFLTLEDGHVSITGESSSITRK